MPSLQTEFDYIKLSAVVAAGAGIQVVNTTASVAAGGVTDAMLRQSAARSVIGRSAATSGNVADITAAADGQALKRVAGVLAFAAVPAALFDHYVNAGNSGTAETDLYSVTIAAAQLAANGDKLRTEYGGAFVSSGTATRQVRIYFGGTLIFDTGALTLSLSSAWTVYVTIVRVSATVVRYMASFTTQGAALAAYTSSGEVTGLTLANTNILKITGQAAGVGAATNDIVARLGYVEFLPVA